MSTAKDTGKDLSLVKRTLLALETMQARLDAIEQARIEPIAIVGMGCRFPGGAHDPEAFWRLLEAGGDGITEVPGDRWDIDAYFDPQPATPGKMSTRWGGFLDRVDGFDASFFGISPREALRMDPQQRLLLEVAWEALEDAGQTRERLAGTRTGVFAGICSSDYSWLQFANPEGIDAYTGTGNSLSILAGRLAYLLDLKGPSLALDTACSSSLVAVHLACQSLRSKECQLALAGGVNLMLSPHTTILASQMRMMAADGRCKAFDARADGFVRGEGCGVVVLKRLSDARADGDTVLALIRGSAVNGDGRTVGLTAPNGLSQQAVIRAALESAGVKPGEISYVEAHGTGTSLGDPIEMEALSTVLGQSQSDRPMCVVGSVKTNIGHLEAAAGVAGLIKVVLALRHRAIPPVLHFRKLNPNISLEGTRLAITTELQPWESRRATRLAGTSAFGWSGTNAHVVLEEAPPAPFRPSVERGPNVLALSAHCPEALRDLARSYQSWLPRPGTPAVADICSTASVHRTHHDHRLALVGNTQAELVDGLAAFLAGEARPGLSSGVRARQRKLVFVFPGQGGQWPGMARDLLASEPVFRAAIEACEKALRPHVDWSLCEVLAADPPDGRLERIDVIQPALFALQVALAALWRSWGIEPDAVVGHSMGEVAAAHVAGALGLEDAARIMARRSQILRRTSGHGAMAVVELPLDEAQRALAGREDRVAVAASNGPSTTVLSGDPAALNEILATLEAREVFCRAIKVDVASHSPQMDPLRAELEAALAGVAPTEGSVPIYSTVTVAIAAGKQFDGAYWVRNLRQPVLFAPAVEKLLADGHDLFLELSPHPTLAMALQELLARGQRDGAVLPSLRRDEPGRASLQGSLGALWSVGYPVDFRRQYPAGGPCVSLPAYPWQRERFWHAPERSLTALALQRPTGHPLIGHRLTLAALPGQHVWEVDLDLARVPFIDDHRVQGLAVLPGTGYVEMALAAAAEVFGSLPQVVSSFEFKRLLFFPDDSARTVQVSLAAGAEGGSAFQVHSRATGSDAADATWTLHATGTIHAAGADRLIAERVALREIEARCGDEIPSADFYTQFAERGNQWGPRFQGIARIHRGTREALAELQVPAVLQPELGRYQIHPAVLDACLQVLGATVPVEAAGGAQSFVPVHVDRIVVHGRPTGTRCWSHARLRPDGTQSAATFEGDVRLVDDDGAVLVEFLGLRGRGLDQDAVAAIPENIQEWLYELRWVAKARAASAAAPRAGEPGRWLIFSDESGVGPALARQLESNGDAPVIVTPGDAYARLGDRRFAVRPDAPEDLRRLLDETADRPCRGVFHLWGLEASVDSLAVSQERTCGNVALLLQSLTAAGSRTPPRLWLVTRGAQAVGEDAPVAVAQAPLWGLGRTIPLEHPTLWGALIDLDPGALATESAAHLWNEASQPDGEDQIAYRHGGRHVARLQRRHFGAQHRPIKLRADGAYLITGGLGGLGLVVARWMVERGARHLVLLGRTKIPDRSTWGQVDATSPLARTLEAVAALEAGGAVVHLASADVADEAQLRSCLTDLRAAGLPPLRGVVHAAGVAELKPLQELDGASLQAILRPKVLGGWLLHRLLEPEPLDFFVLFSSMAAVLSSPLLASYAAANAFLDALAQHRRAQGLPATSIGWGFWEEVGMGVRFQQQAGRARPAPGMGGIAPAQGLAILDRILAEQLGQVGVMPIDWARWRQHHPGAARLPFLADLVGAPSAPAMARPRGPDVDVLLAAPEAERAPLLEGYLRRQIARVLRLAEARLDVQVPLSRLGLDSLMAVELKSAIETDLGVALPLVKFLQGPSVVQLSAQLGGLLAAHDTGAATNASPQTPLPAVVADPVGRHRPFPLNDIQQAYWVGRNSFVELGNVAAHMYLEVDSVALDLGRLASAWQRLIARHDMLRAIVLSDGQQQVLAEVPAYPIEVQDLRGQPAELASRQLEATREHLSHQVMRTDRWPLFEIRGSRFDDRRLRLHLSFDILIADVWSWQILFREWAQLYRDPDAQLPPLDLTFRDYILAERTVQKSDAWARSLDHWKQRLATLPPAPELPLATSPGALANPRFVRRTARLEPEVWRRLKARGAQAGLTSSGMLLAAFAEVLSAWSKSPRFTINVTLFNRLPLHPRVKDIVGDFTSVNLLAVDVTAGDDFEARAQRLQRQLWEDLEHSSVSGVRVMRELTRTQGGAPRAVMPIVFTSTLATSYNGGEESFPIDWLGEMAYSISQTPQVWLDHQVFEHLGALVFNWDAVDALFPAGLLDDLFGSYCELLKRLADSEMSWHELERHLVPSAQLEQRAAVNATGAFVSSVLLHTLFEERASQQPDALAVIAAGKTLSYAELHRRSTALARELRERGARPGQLVAVVMEKGWEQVVAVMAVLQAGAAYLPISPGLPRERLAYLLEHGEVQLVLTQPWLDGRLEWPPRVTRMCVDATEPAPSEPLSPAQQPDDLAYVIYTSGSTGLPKGVMIEHRAAVNTILDLNALFGIGPGDRVLALSSLSFDLSVYDIFGTLAAGGAIVMPEPSAARDPARWWELMFREQVTIWNSVPALMQALVDYAGGQPERLPRSLRLVLMSGDWIPVSLPDQIRALVEGIRIYSLGGATEAAIWSILHPIEAVAPDWKSIPYGKPMVNQWFHVLNELFEPCPVGVVGQLHIGGLGLARGYWRDEEKTRKSFITHPRSGERLYRTGDLGRYLPDGNIEFLGREDFQVKVNGFRIELGEIEAVLEQHPAVAKAVAAAFGARGGTRRLVGYFVPRTGESPGADELRRFLLGKLPEYMVPSTFMSLTALPLSANGKVDRASLPAPGSRSSVGPSAVAEPGPLDARICQLIAKILEVDAVAPDANLLDLGASSLDMIRIANLLQQELGARPQIDEFYQEPTIRGLARWYAVREPTGNGNGD